MEENKLSKLRDCFFKGHCKEINCHCRYSEFHDEENDPTFFLDAGLNGENHNDHHDCAPEHCQECNSVLC